MTWHDWLRSGLLVLAGAGSGLVGYVSGLASLVSYPALLAFGLPPLTANVTNTVALTGVTVGSVTSARRELTGMRRRVLTFGTLGLGGGTAGALLLLRLPPGVFAQVVPWLVAFGSVVLLLRPWLRRLQAGRLHERHPLVIAVVGVVTVYCGYFGAGAGVLLLATFSAVLPDRMARLAALRSAVVGVANTTAAVIFVLTGSVEWSAVVPLGLGAVVGSAFGPPLVRRLPETPLRVGVALAGLVLAVRLYVTR
ncbi:sulfite exporter TauE/SafE family protein [uncultured Friedmanniella sp.]|uniref:sulfite exporter TauE/SafE family protein n=1 Tax=uncultured Friedmanniella sp. TaxID=335381 RepID=UPI0035C98348